jgi:hypothetical protein
MGTLRTSSTLFNVDEQWDRKDPGTENTVTGTAIDHRRVSIGTSEVEVTLAAAITGGAGPGWAWIKNHGATNYVQIGFATTVYSIRLKAGQAMLLPLDPGVTSLFLKSNTAAVSVELLVYEA